MSKPVMMIVPTENGYVVMPFNDNLLFSLKGAQSGRDAVRVARSLSEVDEVLRDVYGASNAIAEPSPTGLQAKPRGRRGWCVIDDEGREIASGLDKKRAEVIALGEAVAESEEATE